jgi:hypothetical protein
VRVEVARSPRLLGDGRHTVHHDRRIVAGWLPVDMLAGAVDAAGRVAYRDFRMVEKSLPRGRGRPRSRRGMPTTTATRPRQPQPSLRT